MLLTINKRVELVFISDADDAMNQSVVEKFNRIHSDHEQTSHKTVGRLIPKFRETGNVVNKS